MTQMSTVPHSSHGALLRFASCVALNLILTSAQAQSAPASPATTKIKATKSVKAPWSTPTLTDWNSVWTRYRGPWVKSTPTPTPEPTPEYMPYLQAAQKALAGHKEIGHGARCLPPGVPGTFTYPVELIVRPHQVVFLNEDRGYRRIRMNSEHPDYVEPTFVGDSIAHWDGDTLVIDTVGITTKTVLGGPGGGARHSNQLHVIERMREVKPGIIEFRIWMEDPRAFVKPVEWVIALERTPDEQINEHVCEFGLEMDPNISFDAFDHIPEPVQTEVHWAKPKAK